MKKWTTEMDNILKEKYPAMRTDKLAELLNVSKDAAYNHAFALGLKKSEEFLRSPECGRLIKGTTREAGTMYQFPKGNVPHNKGKKQTEYMTAKQIERSKHTRFKKGDLPGNTLHDGAITIRYHKGTGKPYKYIRIGLAKWVAYHRCLWEQAHGPIPAGHNIQFRDGDTLNCDLSNLYMISRADQLKNENSLHARYPEEVRKLIQLKGALKRQINKVKSEE
jgi:hypothetical protein